MQITALLLYSDRTPEVGFALIVIIGQQIDCIKPTDKIKS